VLAASVTAFAVIEYAGALYLFWLGVRMVRSRDMPLDEASPSTASSHAFRQGVATEVLNPISDCLNYRHFIGLLHEGGISQ
jgi:threonine/homoserine/homoserine lactone efflux protein